MKKSDNLKDLVLYINIALKCILNNRGGESCVS